MPKPKTDKTAQSNKAAADGPTIDPKLISVLVCPKTRGPITYDRVNNELLSKKAKLAFPIREGVPIMLVEEARSLDT